MFSNVLVGVDRHLGGRDAVALAKRLVAQDGKLTLAHVYPGDSRLRRTSTFDYGAMEQGRALELLRETRARAEIRAELRYAEASSPGRGLRQLAESIGADVLVVGSSHRGKLGRVLLGDDTHGALNNARCVVAVAPAGYALRMAASARSQSEPVGDEVCPPAMTPAC